ncbi:MAG: 16S rRNA (uracil(1498)-N(3))-methyltransferase [Phycisphaeraceae bacterium]|nr:16S rRNA (uracil(1498)-N(3))-methyltransferase [Phycisphaeraceae bacterium]
MHRIVVAGLPEGPGEVIEVSGEEAHHAARVRRLGPDDAVVLLDLRGGTALARVREVTRLDKRAGWVIRLVVESVGVEDRIVPALRVYAEPPKGDDLLRMVDQLSQVGAASWGPLACERSEVNPRDGKLERAHRAALESAKQCSRAWGLEIESRVGFREAVEATDGGAVVVAHAGGAPYRATGHATIRLLVGPVGDLSDEELDAARRAGVQIAAFGPLVMRIDTACIAASAIIMDAERRERERNGDGLGR